MKTQPSSFLLLATRQRRNPTLSIDVRNGGEGTHFGNRELHACTVVMRAGQAGEAIAEAVRKFCRVMCTHPRLPAGPLFGANDWNYAYGKNTAAGILRDADLIAPRWLPQARRDLTL